MSTVPRAPVLVLGIGNPSRGDDALGPLALEALEGALAAEGLAGVADVVTDFQLQVEHALDAAGRTLVVFVDATVEGDGPYAWSPAVPSAVEATHSTHALSPGAVLAVCRRLGMPVPRAEVLAIRGEAFALGAPLSVAAAAHLRAAVDALVARVRAAACRTAG